MSKTAAVLAVLLTATSLLAQESKDPAAADALFRAGRAFAEQGQHEAACERFGESYRLDPAVGTLLNLAMCEEALGRLAAALEHLQRVVDQLDATDERAVMAQARLRALEPRVPRLTLRISPGAPSATEVHFDGVRMTAAAFGIALPRDPGRHELRAAAPGREDRTIPVELAEGQRLTLVVEPGPQLESETNRDPMPKASTSRVAPRAAAPAPPAPGPSLRETAGIALLGAGTASLVAAGVMGVLLLRERTVVDEHCPDRLCDERGVRAAGAASTLQTGAIISSIATAGLGVTGAALLLAPAGAGTGDEAVAPGVPVGAMATLVGRF